MAITEKYANFGLTTGLNDGTSEADAWQTPADIVEAAGERVNVKTTGGRYTITTSWASSANGSATQPILIRGYSSTIGDGGKCLLGGSITSLINMTGKYTYMGDFDIESSTSRYNTVVTFNSNQGVIYNTKIVRTTTGIISSTNLSVTHSAVVNCYIEGRGSNASEDDILYLAGSAEGVVVNSVNGQSGVEIVSNFAHNPVNNILVYSQASTTLHGIKATGLTNLSGFNLSQFTIDGFDDGVLLDTLPTAKTAESIMSCGIISGAVDAISTNEATTRTGVAMYSIAFYNNTNDYSGMGDNEVINPISCTADPYEDSASGDFRPNTTASGGALLQGASGFGAGEVTTNRDIGALQHADPAGGGGGCKMAGSSGGMAG